jgi:hypothetical protein
LLPVTCRLREPPARPIADCSVKASSDAPGQLKPYDVANAARGYSSFGLLARFQEKWIPVFWFGNATKQKLRSVSAFP